MAKYLGGIEDSNIEIVGISQHFFSSGFDIQYYNYQLDTLAVQKLDIAKSLVKDILRAVRYGESSEPR